MDAVKGGRTVGAQQYLENQRCDLEPARQVTCYSDTVLRTLLSEHRSETVDVLWC